MSFNAAVSLAADHQPVQQAHLMARIAATGVSKTIRSLCGAKENYRSTISQSYESMRSTVSPDRLEIEEARTSR